MKSEKSTEDEMIEIAASNIFSLKNLTHKKKDITIKEPISSKTKVTPQHTPETSQSIFD